MSAITFTLIQTNLAWEDKSANLHMLEQKINSLEHPTQIVVLPEMFSTAFSMNAQQLSEKMDGQTIEWMRNVAQSKKIILTGSLIIEEEGKFYNRLIWMLPTGQFGYYNKRHLFAYGDEDKFYTPGKERMIASVNGWKINLLVCYDLRFPVWSRQAAPPHKDKESEAEYDVLLYVANWPDKRSIAWRTLLRARAIENQCYVVGVNRVGHDGNNIYHSGHSMVVDPLGEILYHKPDDEDVFTLTLQKDQLQQVREKFPFWRDADDFKIFI